MKEQEVNDTLRYVIKKSLLGRQWKQFKISVLRTSSEISSKTRNGLSQVTIFRSERYIADGAAAHILLSMPSGHREEGKK